MAEREALTPTRLGLIEAVLAGLKIRRAVWITGIILLLVGVLVAVEAIERRSLARRYETFSQRVGRITEGMSESQVRAVAGPPDEIEADLRRTGDGRDMNRAGCSEANATAAMVYSFEQAGWISEKLRISSGFIDHIFCLDEQRRVVKDYVVLTHF